MIDEKWDCWRMKMKDFSDVEGEHAKILADDLKKLKRRFGGDGKIEIELKFSTKHPKETFAVRICKPRCL